MATIRDIVIDCADPVSLARFWAAVLDGYERLSLNSEQIARLAALGLDHPIGIVGPGTRIFFQLVPEPKVTKNRWHVDLSAPDAETEAARIVTLGGRILAPHEHWITMADPEGNEFCVMR